MHRKNEFIILKEGVLLRCDEFDCTSYQKQMEEEKNMCEALNELFAEELKEADLRGRKEGRKEGRSVGQIEKLKELVQKKLAKNQSIEKIADDLVEDVEVIRKIVKELNA